MERVWGRIRKFIAKPKYSYKRTSRKKNLHNRKQKTQELVDTRISQYLKRKHIHMSQVISSQFN